MKKLMILTVLISTTLLIVSCGGGGGGGIGVGSNAPTISNLQFSPAGAYVNSGGGTGTLSATLDFIDPDGNIATMTISAFDSNGILVDTQTGPIQGTGGVTSGTIGISGNVDITVLGVFTFKVYVTDSSGLKSNVLVGTFKVTEFPWQSKTVIARDSSGVATSLDGLIYHIYGYTDLTNGNFTLFETYDPATDIWTTKSSLPNTSGGFAALAAVNGKIYGIGGGYTPVGGKVVEEYDPISDTWTIKSPMPTPRSNCSASVLNGKIYVIGGYSAGFDLSTVEVYDPVIDQWTTAPPMPTPRKDLTTSVANGKIYAIGGYRTESISGYLSTVEEYNPTTNIWSTKTPMSWPPLSGMASGTINGKIYVTGGGNWSRDPSRATWGYNPLTDEWKVKTDMPSGLIFPTTTTAVVNDKLYVIGSTLMFEYTPDNDIL